MVTEFDRLSEPNWKINTDEDMSALAGYLGVKLDDRYVLVVCWMVIDDDKLTDDGDVIQRLDDNPLLEVFLIVTDADRSRLPNKYTQNELERFCEVVFLRVTELERSVEVVWRTMVLLERSARLDFCRVMLEDRPREDIF